MDDGHLTMPAPAPLTTRDMEMLPPGKIEFVPTPVPRNIFQRINAVRRAVRSVDKTAKHAKGFNYSGHDAVTEAIRDGLVEHGIVRYATVVGATRSPDGSALMLNVDVVYVNEDDPTDRFVSSMLGESFSMSKDRVSGAPIGEPTQSGIALSYAVKCADLKVFALVGDATPDAEREKAADEPARARKPALTEGEARSLQELFSGTETQEQLVAAKSAASTFAQTREISPEQMTALVKAQKEAVGRIQK